MRNVIVFLSMAILLPSSSNAQDFWQSSNGPHTGYIVSLATNSSGHIFAASKGEVFRSTDHGKNWTLTGLPETGIMSLGINADGHIFAGTVDGVFRSTDNGDHWTLLGLTDVWVNSFGFNSSGDIFAGTRYDGVFRSTDNGENWTSVGINVEIKPSLTGVQ